MDAAVRSITHSYDELGRRKFITSRGLFMGAIVEDPVSTNGALNQVVFGYDDIGALATRWENHAGVATTSGMSQSPNVQFAYDNSAASSIFNDGRRLTKVTYPSGRAFHYDYGTAATVNDYFNRLIGVFDDLAGSPNNQFLAYDYNGVGHLMRADTYVTLNYQIGAAGTYGGWDRFARIKDQYWTVSGGSDADRFKYEYDYAGNPKYRDIDAAIYATNTKDQAWAYDGLERLKTFDKGTLSGTTITGTPARAGLEARCPGQLGWDDAFVVKTSGTTILDQSRTHNKVNEITGVTASTGDNWYDPTFDLAGNMATGPRRAHRKTATPTVASSSTPTTPGSG